MNRRDRCIEVAHAFLRLGLLSFGGPTAHIAYFHGDFVEKRKWLDEAHFADLVALCQFLPGPASSQLVFAIGMHRAGLLGALLSSLAFTLPSAALMIAFAFGVASFPHLASSGAMHGLKLAAVAVVAQAVWSMGRKLCTDLQRTSLMALSAAVLLLLPGTWTQIAVIAAAGILGRWCFLFNGGSRATETCHCVELRCGIPQVFLGRSPCEHAPLAPRSNHRAKNTSLLIFASLLVLLPMLALSGVREVVEFAHFYRSGALVFGGGHVVLPLLREALVPSGWLSDDSFLAGYAAAQALPGPLFAFSAYLGTTMHPGDNAVWYGLLDLLAMFLPALLLIAGVLPFWDSLRTRPSMQAALAGVNAAVVGVLLATLYDPIFQSAVHDKTDAAAALLAFASLEYWKRPPWLVVAALAAVGGLLL